MNTKKIEPTAAATDERYTLGQLRSSEKYMGRRDLLDALLDPDAPYTIQEVDAVMDRFLKGKVK